MNKSIRSALIALVFVAGCAVGGAASSFVVPPASAQQQAAPGFQRWDYMCFNESGSASEDVEKMKRAGAEGWELAGQDRERMCFKRPLPR